MKNASALLVRPAAAGGMALAVLGADDQVLIDAGDGCAGIEGARLREALVEGEIVPLPIGDVRLQVRAVVGRDAHLSVLLGWAARR